MDPEDLIAAADRCPGEIGIDELRRILKECQARFEAEAESMLVTQEDLNRAYTI